LFVHVCLEEQILSSSVEIKSRHVAALPTDSSECAFAGRSAANCVALTPEAIAVIASDFFLYI